MELFKKIPWEYEKKNYELQILYDENHINIVTFLNNHPANGFRYHIQIPKNINIRKLLQVENYSHLIDLAKEDIRRDRWNQLLIQRS